jgi:hypothetical protein
MKTHSLLGAALLFTALSSFSFSALAGADIPPPPPLPDAQGTPADLRYGYDAPSSEMDFNVPQVPPASFEDVPAPAAPIPNVGLADDTPPPSSSQDEVIDQFFSTTTILPEEPKPNPELVMEEPVEAAKPEPKKKISRNVSRPGAYTLLKKRRIDFHSVILPESLYRKAYGLENRHLPQQQTYSDLQDYLALAIMRGDLNQIRALVGRGADIHLSSPNGETYLILAARYQQADAVRWLLQNGVQAQAADASGITALHYAAKGNNHIIANLLLRYGANPNAADMSGHTPLTYAEYNGAMSTAEVLRAFGAS